MFQHKESVYSQLALSKFQKPKKYGEFGLCNIEAKVMAVKRKNFEQNWKTESHFFKLVKSELEQLQGKKKVCSLFTCKRAPRKFDGFVADIHKAAMLLKPNTQCGPFKPVSVDQLFNSKIDLFVEQIDPNDSPIPTSRMSRMEISLLIFLNAIKTITSRLKAFPLKWHQKKLTNVAHPKSNCRYLQKIEWFWQSKKTFNFLGANTLTLFFPFNFWKMFSFHTKDLIQLFVVCKKESWSLNC